MKLITLNNLIKNWTWIRIIRLAIGLFILLDGVMTKDNTVLIVGIVLLILPIVNIGGCSPYGSCSGNVCSNDAKGDEKNN